MIETKVSSIDRIIHHCEVISIPAGSVPKNIVVQLPGGDGPRVLAWWNGATLAVGSMVKLLKRGLDGTYEIFGLDGGTPTPLNNYTATDDPQPDDDADDGYSAGSIWLNITDHRAWICIISTANAAVWRPFGLGPLATFFLHEEASDIATYQQLLETPAEDAENDDSVSVGSGDGEVLIKAFATESGGLGLTLLPGGDWEFHIYSYVDNAVGVSQIVVRVYKYEVDTTETELFNVTSQEIDDLSVTEYTVSSVQPDFALVATDRLVVKYFAQTTSVANRTVHLVYEGMTNYSHIHTPLTSSGGGVTDHGALTGLTDDDHTQYLLATGARTGASSQAQQFTGDVRVTDLELGIYQRSTLFRAASDVLDEFDTDTLSGTWGMASVPFVNPSLQSLTNYPSCIQIGHSTANNRVFMYTSVSTAGNNIFSFLPRRFPTGMYAGYRFDDGTDNNYVETQFVKNASGVFDLTFAYLVGGPGTPTTGTLGPAIDGLMEFYWFGLNTFGTKWSSWSYTLLFALPGAAEVDLYVVTTGLSWTPTRQGIIYFQPTGSTNQLLGPIIDRVLRY